MLVRMKHEEHGFTHAYTLDEIEAMKQRGWEIEKEIMEFPGQKPTLQVETQEAPKEPPKKRGRPKGSKNRVKGD